jgi:hypothetical protein
MAMFRENRAHVKKLDKISFERAKAAGTVREYGVNLAFN